MLSENILGIDYHLKSIQVCVMNSAGERLGNKKLPNDLGEVILYASRFGSIKGGAIEVSCGASTFVDQLRQNQGWDIQLCHPGYVNRMKCNPDKSDKTDAELLADLYRVGYLPKVWLAPLYLQDLRQLVRYRTQQVNIRKQIKLRLLSTLRQFRIQTPPKFNLSTQWSREWLKLNLLALPEHSKWITERQFAQLGIVENEVKIVDKRLSAWTKEDPLTEWLMQFPNIGLVTATLIRAEVGTASRFSNGKQFSRFFALTPRNCSSGERQADSGLVRAGNPALKSVIIQVAHLLRRRDSKWINFGERLSAAGKPVQVIVAAIANRWLRGLYYKMLQFEMRSTAATLH